MKKSTLLLTLPAFALGFLACSKNEEEPPPPPPPTRITLLQTTDLHHMVNGVGHVGVGTNGQVVPGETGGFARIAAYVNAVRTKEAHPVVLVDSGDWSMGSIYDLTLTQQPIGLYSMMALGYNCITLGNHEFDYTPQGLAGILNAAKGFGFWTHVVQSNMNINGSPYLTPFAGTGKMVKPWVTETLSSGLKVGYLGYMGKAADTAAPSAKPVTFTTDYATIQSQVDHLRNIEKCQLVIALSHSGSNLDNATGEDFELAKAVTGIDVIASGHTHNAFAGQTVANGGWNTHVISAGAYGTQIARLDLNVVNGTCTVEGSSLVPMTDAGLTAFQPGLKAESGFQSIAAKTDQSLNTGLQGLFTSVFPDSDGSLETGLYHPVGSSVQEMTSNLLQSLPCPNGLGDLCADANRAVATSLATATQQTPFTASLVATGAIRGELKAGVPLTFTDVYNVFPLGISPDTTQAIPIGFPLVSAYMELNDLKTLCALQLLAQCGLTGNDLYLNLSGIKPIMSSTGKADFFKHLQAALTLKITNEKAATGSADALAVIAALTKMGSNDNAVKAAGITEMMSLVQNDNPYANALAKLTDDSLANASANFLITGEVASTTLIGGESALKKLLAGKALGAIAAVAAFPFTDATCTEYQALAPLTPGKRYRICADLYAILMAGAVQGEIGLPLNAFASSDVSDDTLLTASNMAGVLANRINLTPGGAMTELKEWMSLLQFIGKLPDHQIPVHYASGSNFALWPASPNETFGAAVFIRSSYPKADILKMAQLTQALSAND